MKLRFNKGSITPARFKDRHEWPTTGFDSIPDLVSWFVRGGDPRWSLKPALYRGLRVWRATVPKGLDTSTVCYYWIDHEGDPAGEMIEEMSAAKFKENL